MALNFWSVLLIAFASQCLLLIVILLLKPIINKKATFFLLLLLFVILCTDISNLISASYLYRQMPEIAGFARGMVLLIGPLFYLYTLSVLQHDLRFKWAHWLHFLPYTVALVIIRIEVSTVTRQDFIASVDLLMEGRAVMVWKSNLWYITYFMHFLVYMYLSRNKIASSTKEAAINFIIPLAKRIAWLKQVTIILALLTLTFLSISCYIVVTGYYSINGNYIYIFVLAIIIYMLVYQAISDNRLLTPDFSTKYRSINLSEQEKKILLDKLLVLFEKDKIFTNPKLSIAIVAKQTGTHPNIISQMVNEHFHKSFAELLNQYRIEEFKKRAVQPEYAGFSIWGIANDVGYNSKSSFNNTFRKKTNQTPSEYLKNPT